VEHALDDADLDGDRACVGAGGLAGITTAYYANLPPGGTTVLAAAAAAVLLAELRSAPAHLLHRLAR
jgi:hypothetical protein